MNSKRVFGSTILGVAASVLRLESPRGRAADLGATTRASRSSQVRPGHASRRKTFTVIAVLVPLVLLPVARCFAITFADGSTHTIDGSNSFPFEGVTVQDGPGGIPTTLELVAGGVIGNAATGQTLNAYGSSRVNIFGGQLYGVLVARDASEVQMSGGTLENVYAIDSARLDISGGYIGDTIGTNGSAQAVFSGGSTKDIAAFGDGSGAVMDILGGVVRGRIETSRSTLNIYNAQVGSYVAAAATSTINVFGGEFGSYFRAFEGSTINIRGGTISYGLEALEDALVTVTGHSFNFPFGDIPALSGTLNGVLADGQSINTSFGRSTAARIVLLASLDADSDGVADGLDNCVTIPNASQTDTDGNHVGDACNDAQDADGDEFEASADNCPDIANALQEDVDADRVGDACDPFPNDPDNQQAQCDADLAMCLSGVAPDNDGDGEQNVTDACPDTLATEIVDDAGCSQAEFCAKVDVTVRENRRVCRKSDWMNDEPATGNPRDCEIDKGAATGSADDKCVPYVE